jgi:hypothetical protein
MVRAGTLVEKEPGLKGTFQGEEHAYVRCILADTNDPTRQFECRVLDKEDIPMQPGDSIRLEVIHVVTDRKNGKVRFDCHLAD